MPEAKDKNPKPVKVVKKKETVRERAEKAASATPKTRRLQAGASTAGKPFRVAGRYIAKLLRPLRFVLWPFKTRPMRFVGRILAAVLLFRVFRNAWKELLQVTWPSAHETVRLTWAVFAFSIVFGVVIALVDYGLDKVFRKVFLQ